ncbi:MAG: bifunctional methylenetetrahydrofolate dehydrogenase/methenyltetrahydrofolate cyclohydrolase FolD [Oscillospiraceae bacterium]|jgi:methylenetetrahydrofolate dehydrogenase (NADP+)/methenyltetrahydrofolate cyclohydrolase|nr:bifunctional methylenetetrahydrofolate dehydrogenase/methenyltetrahydrofolate cyclohydrolase FolD [Oscillospiraceae bacterium]
MAAKLIDGKAISAKVKEEVRDEIKQGNLKIGLAVIIVGDDGASRIYVNNKKKACEFCGINSFEYALPEHTSEAELISLIDKLNNDAAVNGILVQQPLPKHINQSVVNAAISPNKDVDAFHSENVGHIVGGDFKFLPCTPAGVMRMLEAENIDVCGKECVVIGRSDIVGKPMALLLLHKHATVMICHSRTKNLAEVTARADVLVSAVGKVGLVTADMVKPGAVVIDVGMNRDEDGKLCGDVAFDEVKEVASLITPVPGGVGPMTIAMLMKNVLTAKKLEQK